MTPEEARVRFAEAYTKHDGSLFMGAEPPIVVFDDDNFWRFVAEVASPPGTKAERNAELRRQHADGKTIEQLCERFDLSRRRVQNILNPQLWNAQRRRRYRRLKAKGNKP